MNKNKLLEMHNDVLRMKFANLNRDIWLVNMVKFLAPFWRAVHAKTQKPVKVCYRALCLNSVLQNMAQHGSESVKQLLIQQLPVSVVFPDRTETSKLLTLSLSLRTTVTPLKTSVSTLELEITDERDPFFLFLLHLPESDYSSLKSELSLTVDFAGFPDKSIHLILVVRSDPRLGSDV